MDYVLLIYLNEFGSQISTRYDGMENSLHNCNDLQEEHPLTNMICSVLT